ncbi:hypothetical protein CYY_008737 [Polysphondylium violaceum]|uniref:Uncharacterized protein n=1 Tax=Polysphondylium violaceum TaxID=133409 RepID=A0A8J4PL47_9MYCE|nr:hypothetical protein CYY_008737 [Polysphondylium violaceum]
MNVNSKRPNDVDNSNNSNGGYSNSYPQQQLAKRLKVNNEYLQLFPTAEERNTAKDLFCKDENSAYNYFDFDSGLCKLCAEPLAIIKKKDKKILGRLSNFKTHLEGVHSISHEKSSKISNKNIITTTPITVHNLVENDTNQQRSLQQYNYEEDFDNNNNDSNDIYDDIENIPIHVGPSKSLDNNNNNNNNNSKQSTIINDILPEKILIKMDLKKMAYMSLTHDIWTNRGGFNQSFFSISAHGLVEENNLLIRKTFTLDTYDLFFERQTSKQHLASLIKQTMDKWELDPTKVYFCIGDNDKIALEFVNEANLKPFICLPYSLQLALNPLIENNTDSPDQCEKEENSNNNNNINLNQNTTLEDLENISIADLKMYYNNNSSAITTAVKKRVALNKDEIISQLLQFIKTAPFKQILIRQLKKEIKASQDKEPFVVARGLIKKFLRLKEFMNQSSKNLNLSDLLPSLDLETTFMTKWRNTLQGLDVFYKTFDFIKTNYPQQGEEISAILTKDSNNQLLDIIDILKLFNNAIERFSKEDQVELSLVYIEILKLTSNLDNSSKKVYQSGLGVDIAMELSNHIHRESCQFLGSPQAQIATFLNPKYFQDLARLAGKEKFKEIRDLVKKEANIGNDEIMDDDGATEIHAYIVLSRQQGITDPLEFWLQYKKSLPQLYDLVLKYMSIPSVINSPIPLERIFSNNF